MPCSEYLWANRLESCTVRLSIPIVRRKMLKRRLISGPVDGDGRRSIYTKVTIMEPSRLLATFNAPDPKIPTGQRDVSNTPAQSLTLLNDEFVT